MLDIFLDAAAEQEKNASAIDELTEAMKELPLEELQKIASGKTKLSFYDSDPKWLKQFEGTPLYEQAIVLEQECIKAESERIEKQMAEREQRESSYDKQDMLRLKKKQLELQLANAKLSGEVPKGGEEEEEEEDDDDDEEVTVEASARFVHSIIHGFPKQANMGAAIGQSITNWQTQRKLKKMQQVGAPPTGAPAPALAAMKKAAHAIRLHPKA